MWTHKLDFYPDTLRRHPKIQIERTRKQLRIVPKEPPPETRVSLMSQSLKCCCPDNAYNIGFLTAPVEHFQVSKKVLYIQPQWRSENTPATIEANPTLLALQKMANKNITANFDNNIHCTCNLPKSLTTTMPTFDEKSGKLELFEHLFQTNLKIHNSLTEDKRLIYFYSLMRGDACRFSKTSAAQPEKICEFCQFSMVNTSNLNLWPQQNKPSRNLLLIQQTKIGWFSWWTSQSDQKSIRISCSGRHWTIHICQNATTTEEINKPGPLGKWHIWTDFHTPWKGIRIERFGRSWRAIYI